MYSAIRILIFIVFSVGLLGVIRMRLGSLCKKHILCVIALSIVLCSVAQLIPIENCWMQFETPEQAFQYICTNQIIDVTHAAQSCMISYSTGRNTYSHIFLRSEDGQYKITNMYAARRVSESLTSDGYFEILHVQGTDDYYLLGTVNTSLGSIELFDKQGNHIDFFPNQIAETAFIHSSLSKFENGCYLIIDGTKKVVLEMM